MMRKIYLLSLLLAVASLRLTAQCPVTNITGNFSPANGDSLSGVYNISGNFTLGPGITVHVRPVSSNGCGQLEINAAGNVFIAGTINANGAGNVGGISGAAGLANNINNIEACSSPTDLCADIIPFGGAAGGSAFGNGAGVAGLVGINGTGRKNRCLNFGDEGGRAGGAGGAGAGAGGTYGGLGTVGANGGNGSLPTMSTADVTCTAIAIAAGPGNTGGAAGIVFGTNNGTDIGIGAGGAGAGGGGRGRFAGTAGGLGGRGGGMVKIVAGGTLTFTGIINANGTDGQNGGNGGNAGSSTRCCTDACAGVDEYTHTGAGGGGGGAGGGSGGGVLLEAIGTASVTGVINARGGAGGAGGTGGTGFTMNQSCFLGNSSATAPAGTAGGFGGGGSGGRVKVFFNPCASGNNVSPTMTVTGGNGNVGPAQLGTTFTGSQNPLTLGAATPATQAICFGGDPGNLNCLPPSGGIGTYVLQWQSQTNCIGPWNNIPGATSLNFDPPLGLQDTTCYRLSVTSGTCVSFSDTLRVDVFPAINVPVVPTGPVTACIGDSIPLTTSGGSGATYQWLFNGIPIPTANDSFWVATNSGSYTVQIQYSGGCGAASAPVAMTFSNPPSAFAVALTDTVLCPGASANLLGVGTGNFQWLFNGIPIPGATNASLNATQLGSYTLSASFPGGCSAISAPINLVAGLPANAQVVSAGATQFCSGDSVLLTGSGGSSFAWLMDGLPIMGATSNTLQVLNSGNYQVVATSVDGCQDTSAALGVTVNPSPVATIIPAGSPVTCLGDSVVFYSTGGGSYQWLYNGSLLPDTTAYYHAGLQGDYTVIVTTAAGCTDTSVTFAFTYYPPIITEIQSAGSSFLCGNDSVLLFGSGPGAVSWSWNLNDTLLVGANGSSLYATTTGTYAAIATDIYGCEYSSPFYNIYPGQDPEATLILLGNQPVCPGETLILRAGGGDTYSWLYNGQVIPGEVSNTLAITQGGYYQVVVSTDCGSDVSDPMNIYYSTGPQAALEYYNLPDAYVQFRDRSISAAFWSWDFGDSIGTSNLQNPLYQYEQPGLYAVTLIVTDMFGCRDTIIVGVIVTDPDVFIPNVFSPNGDGNNDVAQTNFWKMSQFDFRIYDRWGHLVFVTQTQDEWWNGQINGKDAPEGVYFYTLEGQLPLDRVMETRGHISLLR